MWDMEISNPKCRQGYFSSYKSFGSDCDGLLNFGDKWSKKKPTDKPHGYASLCPNSHWKNNLDIVYYCYNQAGMREHWQTTALPDSS